MHAWVRAYVRAWVRAYVRGWVGAWVRACTRDSWETTGSRTSRYEDVHIEHTCAAWLRGKGVGGGMCVYVGDGGLREGWTHLAGQKDEDSLIPAASSNIPAVAATNSEFLWVTPFISLALRQVRAQQQLPCGCQVYSHTLLVISPPFTTYTTLYFACLYCPAPRNPPTNCDSSAHLNMCTDFPLCL
jgi:hypothetical protein